MGKVKDSIYNFLVRKNKNVQYEYERYVMEHTIEHYENRFKHWKILFKLNWHYRVKKEFKPLLYFDHNKKNDAANSFVKSSSKTSSDMNIKKVQASVSTHVYNGSESASVDLPSPYHFAAKLSKFEVISFDIFDTMIFRPFSDPKDLFIIVQEKLNYNKFAELRVRCELKARELKSEFYGTREIKIENIYDLISWESGLDSCQGVEIEYQTELEFCFANPYMKTVYEILKGQNKKIIFTSDMYYDKKRIKKLLENCGYSGEHEIYVSCEYEVTKSSGRLFDVLLKKYSKEELCHVGDNVVSDVEVPRSMGISCFYYPNVQNMGNRYRICTRGMSRIIGSAYAGVVNWYLENGNKQYSEMYEFGFLYGGLYVLGYANWIHKMVELHSIDKVLFMARDGLIISDVFNNMFDDVENDYLLWSRIVTAKLSVETNGYEFIRFIRNSKANGNQWLEKAFEQLGIKILYEQLSEKERQRMNSSAEEAVDYVNQNWKTICKLLEEDNNATKETLRKMTQNCKKVAIVDIGWQGSAGYTVKEYLENVSNKEIQIYSFLLGSLSKEGDYVSVLNDDHQVYAFSESYNRHLYDLFRQNNNFNAAMFEIFTQAQSPMFKAYKFNENGEIIYEFMPIDVHMNRRISEIHRGIKDFCILYKETFSKYQFMFTISGHDALAPFRVMSMDKGYISNQLHELLHVKNI